jgi:O-antigen ligase
MTRKEILNRVNIGIVCGILFWETIQKTILKGIDGQGRFLLVLVSILLIRNVIENKSYRNRLFSKESPIKIWFFWFLFASINTLFQYSLKDIELQTFIGIYLFVPFAIKSTIASISSEYTILLIKWLGITVYTCLILYFSNIEIESGRFKLDNFDPNEFSLFLFLIIVLIGLGYFLNKLSELQVIFLLLLPIYFSIMLGSRMGFIGTLLLTSGIFIISYRKGMFISLPRFFIIIILTIVPLSYIFNNTVLGERLNSTTENSAQLKENYAEGTSFEKFGDRGLYYVLGWEAFKNSPLIGIGLRNFKDNYYYTVIHSEYMVHLAELGIIGFSLYLLFLFKVLKSIYKARKEVTLTIQLYNYLLIVFCVLIISATVLFMYHSIAVAIIFGLLLFCIKKETIQKFKLL